MSEKPHRLMYITFAISIASAILALSSSYISTPSHQAAFFATLISILSISIGLALKGLKTTIQHEIHTLKQQKLPDEVLNDREKIAQKMSALIKHHTGTALDIKMYRGYDIMGSTYSKDFRELIINQMNANKINEFTRIMTITNEHAIEFVVDWIDMFSKSTSLRERTTFYVTYRKQPNFAAFVILSNDYSLMTFPDIHGNKWTHSLARTGGGVLFNDSETAKHLDHHIDSITDSYDFSRNGRSFHGMRIKWRDHITNDSLNKEGLKKELLNGLKRYHGEFIPVQRCA